MLIDAKSSVPCPGQKSVENFCIATISVGFGSDHKLVKFLWMNGHAASGQMLCHGFCWRSEWMPEESELIRWQEKENIPNDYKEFN